MVYTCIFWYMCFKVWLFFWLFNWAVGSSLISSCSSSSLSGVKLGFLFICQTELLSRRHFYYLTNFSTTFSAGTLNDPAWGDEVSRRRHAIKISFIFPAGNWCDLNLLTALLHLWAVKWNIHINADSCFPNSSGERGQRKKREKKRRQQFCQRFLWTLTAGKHPGSDHVTAAHSHDSTPEPASLIPAKHAYKTKQTNKAGTNKQTITSRQLPPGPVCTLLAPGWCWLYSKKTNAHKCKSCILDAAMCGLTATDVEV